MRGPVYEGVPFEIGAGGLFGEIADVVLSQRRDIECVSAFAVHARIQSSRDQLLVALGEFDGDARVKVI